MQGSKLTKIKDIRQYITANKPAFTLVSSVTGRRYTYKMEEDVFANGIITYKVYLLQGDDNTKDYHFIGRYYPAWFAGNEPSRFYLRRNGESYYRKSNILISNGLLYSESAILYLLLRMSEYIEKGGEFWTSGYCAECGRLLTDPESISCGLGPHCRRKIW